MSGAPRTADENVAAALARRPDAPRLLGIAPEECAKLVERLVAEEFLRWTSNGELVRSESGRMIRQRDGFVG